MNTVNKDFTESRQDNRLQLAVKACSFSKMPQAICKFGCWYLRALGVCVHVPLSNSLLDKLKKYWKKNSGRKMQYSSQPPPRSTRKTKVKTRVHKVVYPHNLDSFFLVRAVTNVSSCLVSRRHVIYLHFLLYHKKTFPEVTFCRKKAEENKFICCFYAAD